MEHEAGVDLEPAHVVGPALAGQQAEACRVVRVPGVRQGVEVALGGAPRDPGDDRVGQRVAPDDRGQHQPGGDPCRPRHRREHLPLVEDHRQVVEHDVVLGEREVVHHRAAPDLHRHRLADVAVGAPHRVVDPVAAQPVVGHRVQLPGLGVLVRVGGVAGGQMAHPQRAVEVGRADGVELVGQLVRRRARLDQREGLARVGDHVGVGREVAGRPVVVPGLLAESARHGVGAHVAVAVPLRLSVDEAHAVHHPVAEEPVVALAGVAHRVRADAQVAPVEVLGQLPGHREVGHGLLLVHGSEVVLEIAVRHGDQSFGES